MTKLSVSYPSLAPKARQFRLTAKILSLLWTMACCAAGLAAIMVSWAAYMQ